MSTKTKIALHKLAWGWSPLQWFDQYFMPWTGRKQQLVDGDEVLQRDYTRPATWRFNEAAGRYEPIPLDQQRGGYVERLMPNSPGAVKARRTNMDNWDDRHNHHAIWASSVSSEGDHALGLYQQRMAARSDRLERKGIDPYTGKPYTPEQRGWDEATRINMYNKSKGLQPLSGRSYDRIRENTRQLYANNRGIELKDMTVREMNNPTLKRNNDRIRQRQQAARDKWERDVAARANASRRPGITMRFGKGGGLMYGDDTRVF